ncbi:MAG: hypothetical protein UR69_C0001G0149 [Candidatus Moranbacteria bacterium GW2011_GWE2_35_2-]|nr:MAG: hypothetical protein UR69_C0001G0149 [Candidatus Moranbacteria bacterium GW2011_GWE2_35_2-]KKQ22853.1 MAG: hypothetical protein US37_C0001G0125 [Candidatus Moranbacteria bacterium GW2011_GWF2_37_11]KKQ30916.1 MAG: hypothetical protein US47_C0001G0149 [Candidatus Moranbacteria bacterium GW2011_GWE1_37_24]
MQSPDEFDRDEDEDFGIIPRPPLLVNIRTE